jgi:hypothetical protein
VGRTALKELKSRNFKGEITAIQRSKVERFVEAFPPNLNEGDNGRVSPCSSAPLSGLRYGIRENV